MQIIDFTNPALSHTMGRTTSDSPAYQTWSFPYTQVHFHCTGTTVGARLVHHWGYGDIYLGAIIDGMQVKAPVPIDAAHDAISLTNGYPSRTDPNGTAPAERQPVDIILAEHLPNIEHDVIIFKRQDEGNAQFDMHGVLIDDEATIAAPAEPMPDRRIEFYGDSVTCGERCEAICYTGQADPDVDLSGYSNAWHSYAAVTARNLNAQAHLVSQGGASLIDGIDWFHAPDYLGLESIWDRAAYNPELGATPQWDFSRYTPHVVVVAIGQNDAHPYDFMAEDYSGGQARHWRQRYIDFVHALRRVYPNALIVLTTTILQHDPAWDCAIDEVCDTMADPRVRHFMYLRNGTATPGHPRISEQREMAMELTSYLRSFGPELWR